MKILIDTSVIVDYIRTGKGILSELLLLERKKRVTLYIPSVVVLELWRVRSMSNVAVEKSMDRLISVMRLIELTKPLAKNAGNLMREGHIEDLTDAVITVTALYLGAQLATSNEKHFEKVKRLKIFRNKLQKK